MIHVTEKAATKIQELLAKEGVPAESGGLRVGVQGGGCSGLTLRDASRDRRRATATRCSRKMARAFSWTRRASSTCNDTTLDYQEDLMRHGFVFQNPQATRSCGCGSSFTA